MKMMICPHCKKPITFQKPITLPQRTLVNYIKWYWDKNECAPSLKEMMRFMGWNSVSTVHDMLALLQEAGYIYREYSVARSTRVL